MIPVLKKTLFLVCGIALLTSIVSCSNSSDSEKRTVFRYNEDAGISSLDPAFAKDQSSTWACQQLFNGLVQLDDQMNVLPCIAKSWEISDSGRVYQFTLRDDVLFHEHPELSDEQRRVKASDFEYSFKRIVDPEIASPGRWVFNNVEMDDDGYAFNAINDTTFEIRLKSAFAPFLGMLSMAYCSVIPEEVVNFYGTDFRNNPVGTGAFYFKMWKEGVKLVFRKNPDYFEFDNGHRLPYLDAVAISFLVDKQAAFMEFLKGNLDFLSGIDASYKDELLDYNGALNPKFSERFRMVSEPFLNTEYLGFMIDSEIQNEGSSQLLNKNLRQAMNYGFDRAEMIRYLRNNMGLAGYQGIIPAGLPGFDPDVIYYDYKPQLARELLQEAGYPNGQGLLPIVLNTSADYLDMCKYIQHALGELGIPIEIEVNPAGTLREFKAHSKSNFFRASWIADYPDAENYLSLFYSGNFAPAGPNYTHYKSELFDRLYEESFTVVDQAEREALYRQMNTLIMEDAAVIILYYDEVIRFVQKDVHDLGSNPMNMLVLKQVKK